MNSLAVGGYRITGNLNEGIGDASPGSPKAGTITGSPVEGAIGQLGSAWYIDTNALVNYTNTAGTLPTLYGGVFRYVQMLAGASAAVAAGQVCFYDTVAHAISGIVTTDVTAATIARPAGIILSGSWAKGNYWWIQTSGLVYVKCAASVTDTTDGNLAIITQTPAPTVNGVADGTAVTDAVLKSHLGVWAEAPSNGAIKRILMNQLPIFQ